jgi:pimeloyl-ACP methyl ester carboxylesterase
MFGIDLQDLPKTLAIPVAGRGVNRIRPAASQAELPRLALPSGLDIAPGSRVADLSCKPRVAGGKLYLPLGPGGDRRLQPESRKLQPETVVLVHGLWLPGASLYVLARRLRRCGFQVHTFSYAAVRQDLRANAADLQAFVAGLDAAVVHFVGHSLGGIVIRALFHHFPRQRPGRIVTLATPHGGSHVGERIARWAVGRRLLGASVRELLAGLPQTWPLPDRDVGVVRGTVPIGAGRLFSNRRVSGDGLLTLEESALPGATDSIELPLAHSAMPFARQVGVQVCEFLRTGRFRHPASRGTTTSL